MIDTIVQVSQPLLAAAITLSAAVALKYVSQAIDAFTARTGVLVTDQQRATILGAVQTAAGVLETKLDQGALSVAHISIASPAVLEQAQAVANAVPQASAALGMTAAGLARMIVGAVDTNGRNGAAVTAVAAAATS